LQVWDWHPTSMSQRAPYAKNCAFILICFRLDGQRSFNNVNSWLKNCEQNYPLETQIILVGTKSDLPDKVVSQDSIAAFCSSHRLEEGRKPLLYFETSAKDNKGVNELFEAIAKIGVEQADTIRSVIATKANFFNNKNIETVTNKPSSGCIIT
jgi:GTPase SAR1 family protein